MFFVFLGPGPARYAMPTVCGSIGHDMRKYQYPAYSFGLKLGSSRKLDLNIDCQVTLYNCLVLKKDVSPGPAHFIDSAITYRGKDGTPQYSLYSRHKDFGKLAIVCICMLFAPQHKKCNI